ncbi:unnamed protein product [Sphagnum compactum]
MDLWVQFGFQLHKTQLSAVATRSAKEGPTVQSMAAPIFSGELESKRRAPSVVAQLMGLDSLPDELFPPAPRKSCHEPARAYVEASQLPYKENRPFLLRQQSQGSAPASIQSQGPEWPQTVQLTDMNQQLEEKKNQVRATLDQARLALVQGNMSNQNCQLTCEEFQESKEFLNAMNFLQCNKEFFFEFLQQKPDTVFSQRLLEPGSWGLTECVTQLKPLKKARGQEKSCTEGTTERKREAFSPRAFSFQFLESLKPHDSKSQQGKTVDGNETKLSVGSHHEASQCNSSCSRSRIVEADLSPSNVVHPKSRLTEIKSSAKDSMSLKLSRNLVDDGRDCVKDNAQLLVEEVKQKAKQWDRDQRRDEMRYAGQIRGSSNDSTKVGQDIARQAQDANSFAIANDSSRYEVSLSRNTLTGKRVTINRKDIEGSNVTTCNKAGDGALTPTLKPLREHVGRSCTSLPNSPRLAHKPDLTVATKKKKTYVIGKAKALLPDCGDAGLKLKVGADDFVAPMHSGVVEAKCVGESPKPGSLTHVRNVQNSKSAVPSEIIVAEKNALSQPCRAEATSTINANCQNTVMKPEGGHGRPGSQRLRIEAKESSQRDRRPMKCHSAHNTALPCHEQGQSNRANEAADLTCDKHEQPSPVSVLQSPFEEESPSPLEVQPRIHSSTPLIPSLRESKTKSRETTESNLIDNFLPKSLSVFDSLGLRKALCSRRWEDDLTYICNVLHSSGFVDETGSALSMPHSLTQPLGQPIFERLEACYPSSKRESSNRQVLFDAINEILFRKAAPCNLQPWLALKASPPPIGKKIVEEIWLEICNQGFYLQHKDLHDDYLESLVAQDIMNSGMWISLHEDMDSISVKLEHTIFNDLVEEVIQNLISSY